MPELETAKTSDHETTHGLRGPTTGGGAADPPSGMQDWWKTPPSLVPPPAVDPAIYGIEPSDVGVETASHGIAGMLAAPKRHGGPSSGPHTIVDDVAADVASEHAEPASFDSLIGAEGAAAAQAGGPALGRADHMRAGEGARAATMSAQLMMAARKIEASIQKIHDVLKAPVGERSADGVLEHLESLVAEAVREREQIAFVTHEQQRSALKVAPVQEGILHVDRASHQLADAILHVNDFATRHKLPFDSKKVTAQGLKDGVDRLQGAMKTEVDSSKVKRVTESENELQLESLLQSLNALDGTTKALVLAVNEPAPDEKIQEVLPSLHSALRMFKASLVDGLHPTTAMLKLGDRIGLAIAKAWTDSKPFGLQTNPTFRQAHDDMLPALATLESLAKGKKK